MLTGRVVCYPRYIFVTIQQRHRLAIANPQAACLTKNSYQESKCQAQIDALYECCNAFYQDRGEDAKTPSCPKATLLKLKMKQRAQES